MPSLPLPETISIEARNIDPVFGMCNIISKIHLPGQAYVSRRHSFSQRQHPSYALVCFVGTGPDFGHKGV
jgi:hypothetical protein